MSSKKETLAIVFVYGSLRQNSQSEISRTLTQQADFIGYASYQGRLYQIDYYPGAVPSRNPAHNVQGELYQLHNPAITLAQLDSYEECGLGFVQPTEYARRTQNVRLCGGEVIQAWVYVYNRPIDNLALITSGDFLQAY
jgi:gamma-glutamylcyclotransferase (GGCT)/AIG2-like uncharacterized protein YtfP